jgi:hypothetical protein
MKNYFKKQLHQMTAWIGAAIVVSEVLRLPDWLIMVMGIVLIALDDDIVKAWCEKLRGIVEKEIA